MRKTWNRNDARLKSTLQEITWLVKGSRDVLHEKNFDVGREINNHIVHNLIYRDMYVYLYKCSI